MSTTPLLGRRPHIKPWYVAYYVPCIQWLSEYSLGDLPGDFCAGLTLASFQIPVSLSYATSLAGLPAISGLFGLIVPPFVYAILGTVPSMVVAPEGPISLIVGGAVAAYKDNPDHRHGRSNLDAEQVSALITAAAGAIILVMGLLRSGFLGSVLSQSMLRGFITGVGAVILADQIPSLLGLNDEMRAVLGHQASSWDKVKFIARSWRLLDPASTVFSVTGLLAILGLKSGKKWMIRRGYKRAILFPEILVVVIVSTIVCDVFNFDRYGLPVVGEVKPGPLEIHWMLRPKFWTDFRINFETSAFISILGVLESTVAARMLGTGHAASSANRELVALGTSNLIAGAFGALPSYGGYGRSKINLLSGAKSQMSGIIISVTTVIVTYFLMGYFFYLPKCTLSAIIASVGIGLLLEAPREIKYFWHVRAWSDLATVITSILLTFFWSVEAGVVAGATVAIIRVIHHATRPRVQILTQKPGSHTFVNAEDTRDEYDSWSCSSDMPSSMLHSKILAIKVPEPLTFANSVVFDEHLRRLERHRTLRAHPGRPAASQESSLELVVFHLKGMTELDASAALMLKRVIQRYLDRGVRVIFTEILPRQSIMDMIDKSGIVDLLESQQGPAIYATLEDAIHDFALD